ncbi:VOC family protein [Trujillonella endophytica]|uniref:Glyoxalase/Bleomycin resistance protein/Dioxygenase superfamily protein n=1 Tax=Trujillonella endophytica TaxID=673521 RepID=A0A1H8PH83_9ACTN|nr:VOC family protein [Trujillella endophytica]SEO41141.1 Glyoxalase/Bleomycin resistance protein/Dioxygenase superfamily protein [Trujillella endophytica]
MRRQALRTGPYGIGLGIHTVHVAEAVEPVARFLEDVLGAVLFMGVDEPNYLEPEDRWACVGVVGDWAIEVMAPNRPVDPTKPVGRFFTKFGSHLHSLGYEVDDIVGLGNSLISRGVYIGAPGGGQLEKMPDDATYCFPSPAQTAGLMVQLTAFSIPGDPRVLDTWSSQAKQWANIHPMGITRLAYQTVGVRDLDEALARYVDLFDVRPIASGVSEAEGARYEVVQLGDLLLRLAEPTDETSPLGRHVARYKNMLYGVTFQVRDLDAAQAWLVAKGIRTERLSAGLLSADPDDTFHMPLFFTTERIGGDPFAA